MGQIFDKYIIIAPGSDYGRAMWSDLETNSDCLFIEYPIDTRNRLIELAHHIHFSFWINNIIHLPFKRIWKRFYSIEKVNFEKKLTYCIIFPDVSACRIDAEYLDGLKRRNNIETVLVNVNVYGKKKKLIDERIHSFSKIFSFDKKDCEKYGFIYHPTIYSRPNVQIKQETKKDAFFVGTYTPERYAKLVQLYKSFKNNGGIVDFRIVGVPKSIKRITGITYNQQLNYTNVIRQAQMSNCIVEIMNPGQRGLTLRSMEAVCLNKKLLTDNRSVEQLDYYSTGFIRICEEITDDDVAFAMNREHVDYQYRDDFSPNQLIAHIEREFGKDSK